MNVKNTLSERSLTEKRICDVTEVTTVGMTDRKGASGNLR